MTTTRKPPDLSKTAPLAAAIGLALSAGCSGGASLRVVSPRGSWRERATWIVPGNRLSTGAGLRRRPRSSC